MYYDEKHMKILFVTNEIPYPPDNGVRIVSYNAMRLMKESGHELAIAILTEEKNNISDRFEKIKLFCNNKFSFIMPLISGNKWLVQLKSLFNSCPYPVQRHQNVLFRNKLKDIIDDFQPDAVHFDIITMTQYYDVVPPGIGTVGSINDSYSLTLVNSLTSNRYTGLNYIYRKYQLFQSRVYENKVYEKIDKIHVMTDVDANYLTCLNRNIEIVAIPNGVNSSLFKIKDRTYTSNDIIFVAKLIGFNLHSLQEFLKNCWPEIHAESPETTLYVVGEVGEEASKVIGDIKNTDGLCFTGYVENLEDAYAKCGIAIVPIDKNCGIINKAIEAMASGIAVVGFHKSFSGIKYAVKDTHYISVSNYNNMTLEIIELLLNKKHCQKIKSSAHLFALDHFSWSSRIESYEKMYHDAVTHARESL